MKNVQNKDSALIYAKIFDAGMIKFVLKDIAWVQNVKISNAQMDHTVNKVNVLQI